VTPARFNSIAGTLVILAAYCNIIVNPLIYIAQYEVVKQPLVKCMKYTKLDNQLAPAAN